MIEKAVSCDTQSLTWFSIVCSWISILNLRRNRDLRIELRLQQTVNFWMVQYGFGLDQGMEEVNFYF